MCSNLSGTAIAGAAGLAQSSKNEQDFSVMKQGDNLQVQTLALSQMIDTKFV
ncbi:hypothetical protein H6G97_41580 [Nostoc flagelliforme FACHB-838]|uniref:Uncharacterized protein n=1 Tax=Nostoc flagelliforme FACHB-838 TaxID=2692904 RepID=A0ABR8E239_9NOSO|nr:hypothetical protein [Nostoc flagelliforme]MBD2535538.1 hypothetical protein [Nostoc flagelliforme FACHB-838]